MSLRLGAASLLVRGRAVMPWLELVDRTVCGPLGALVDDRSAVASVTGGSMPSSPADFREAMAAKHARLVRLLVERKGLEAGVNEGREAMHAAGVDLGSRLRSRLRLDDGEDDLLAAARLLYRMLGIGFDVERDGRGARILVRGCSLSGGYGPLTCEVISAMDEGVVEGLNPRARMTFTRRNSPSSCLCEAGLTWGPRE